MSELAIRLGWIMDNCPATLQHHHNKIGKTIIQVSSIICLVDFIHDTPSQYYLNSWVHTKTLLTTLRAHIRLIWSGQKTWLTTKINNTDARLIKMDVQNMTHGRNSSWEACFSNVHVTFHCIFCTTLMMRPCKCRCHKLRQNYESHARNKGFMRSML